MRPDWDEYFIGLVDAVSERSTCNRGRMGCVIVSQDRCILSTGYCGSPHGAPHCDEVGHELAITQGKEHCIRTIHAEMNAVAQAAKHGIRLDGGIAYGTMVPCIVCARLFVQCGIVRVVCEHPYHADEPTRDLFKKSNIELVVLSKKFLY